MNQKLSVSIVTYNSENDIQSCLKSLKMQTYSDFELTIVDNGSTDRTLEIIAKEYPSAFVIKSGANIGFGAGHNLAIASSHSDWILLLNTDVQLSQTAFANIMKKIGNPKVGAIGGVLYTDKTKQSVDSTGIILNPFFYHAKERKIVPETDDYPWGISGACILLRKTALEQIAYKRTDRDYPEYFDESFFLYKEDLDIAARLKLHGWKSLYTKVDIGIHDRTGSHQKKRKDLPKYVKEQSYKNHFFFLFKHAPLTALPTILLYESIKFFYILVFEPTLLAVMPSVLRQLPTMLKRRYA